MPHFSERDRKIAVASAVFIDPGDRRRLRSRQALQEASSIIMGSLTSSGLGLRASPLAM